MNLTCTIGYAFAIVALSRRQRANYSEAAAYIDAVYVGSRPSPMEATVVRKLELFRLLSMRLSLWSGNRAVAHGIIVPEAVHRRFYDCNIALRKRCEIVVTPARRR